MDGRHQNYIPPTSSGVNNSDNCFRRRIIAISFPYKVNQQHPYGHKQLMHSFEVNIRICQPENSDVHRGEAEVNITFEG